MLPGVSAGSCCYVCSLKERIGNQRPKKSIAAGLRCWAADSQGQIGCIDLVAGKVLHLLKGCAGSVRSLSLHPSAPLVASAGLDRFLRIHDLRSRKSAARLAHPALAFIVVSVSWKDPWGCLSLVSNHRNIIFGLNM